MQVIFARNNLVEVILLKASLRICEQVCGQTDIPGTVAHITRNAGFGGLFKGLGITATREVPAFAVYFSSYEVIVRLAPTGTQLLDCCLSGSLVRARLPFSLVEGWQEFSRGCSHIHKTSSSRDFKRTTLVVLRSTGDPCIVFRQAPLASQQPFTGCFLCSSA